MAPPSAAVEMWGRALLWAVGLPPAKTGPGVGARGLWPAAGRAG